MRYYPTLLYLCLLLASAQSHAQDPTMSQSFSNLQLLNPGAVGFIPGQEATRVAGFARSQWKPLSTDGYYATGVATDFRHCLGNANSLAWGLVAQQDGSRLGAWSNSRLHAALSCHLQLQRHLYLSAGAQAGILQLRLNPEHLRFDQQFTADGYLPTASNGENFDNLSARTLDVHTGLLLYQSDRQWVVGVALHHVNQPRYSFFTNPDGQPDNTLDVGITVHGSFSLSSLGRTRQNQHWKGHVLWRKQSASLGGGSVADRKSQQWQLLAGVQTRAWQGFSAGNYLRFAGRSVNWVRADSYIIAVQQAFSNWQFGLSYDVNLARLAASNRHNGSVELTFSTRLGAERGCVNCPKM